jgi:hypothetical protein
MKNNNMNVLINKERHSQNHFIMRKIYINHREMIRRLEDFYLANKEKIDAIPILKVAFDDLFAENNKFAKAWEVIDQDYSGSTMSKKNIKIQAAKQLAKCHLLLYNYCIVEKKTDDIPNFKFSERGLMYFSDEKLLTRIEFVISYLEEMGENIAGTGLTVQDLTDMKTIYTTYEGMAPRPKVLRSRIKLAKADLEDSRDASMFIINERLDKVMESLFEDSETEFYLNYLEAATVEKVSSTKLALMGTVTDKKTGLAVPQATITIDSIGFKHELRGKKGGFRIQKLEPGSYKLRFEAPTYQTVTVNIIHRQGETNVVHVEMECNTITNE